MTTPTPSQPEAQQQPPPRTEPLQGTAEQLFHHFEEKVENQQVDLSIMQNGQEMSLTPDAPFKNIITGDLKIPILETLSELDFISPSKIQSQAIPILNRDRKSLLAQAPSGSGKTIAFMTSMLLHVNNDIKAPQAICICNTHELTEQVYDVFEQMNIYTKFKGGVCLKDAKPPENDMQLLFGTVSSFITAITKNTPPLDVSHVNFLVVDEADALLSKKNLPFMQRLLKLIPKETQYGFFSATFPNYVVKNIESIRKDIVEIRIKRAETYVKTVQHWYTTVSSKEEALRVMLEITRRQGIQTYIFCRAKSAVEEIAKYLKDQGIQCEPFSSNLAEERKQKLKDFRDSKFLVIVTTDVLARGIDVPQTFLVINYGLPQEYDNDQPRPGHYQQRQPRKISYSEDTYYHRAGRAGRFGRTGLCFTILQKPDEERELRKISSKLEFPLYYIPKPELLK